jgi:hypothetical protein
MINSSEEQEILFIVGGTIVHNLNAGLAGNPLHNWILAVCLLDFSDVFSCLPGFLLNFFFSPGQFEVTHGSGH